MPDFLKPVWSFMQKIGRFLKDTWASVYAYGLYVIAWFAPKPDGFEETLNRIRANDPQLTRLDLSHKRLSYWNIIELCYVLAANTTLTSLNVRGNYISDDGAQALAANTTLTSLDVSWNYIGVVGAQALAANTTLTSLNVSWNYIGDDGAQALAANTTLTSLNVRWNYIGDDGAQALAANTTLTSLNVSGNQIGAAGAQALAANTTLTSLNVSGNCIGAAAAQALAANTTLTSLNVSGNQIGEALRNAIRIKKQLMIETKKAIVGLHAFASITYGEPGLKSLPADIARHIGSFLIPGTECLNDISQRAAVRGSRHMLFQPAVPVESTVETIQPAPTNNV